MFRGGRTTLVALGAAIVLVLATATAAQGFVKGIWGPAMDHGDQFPTYRTLGASLYNDDLWWNQIATRKPADPRNPDDPAYQWPASLAATIAEARQNHMRVMLQVIGAPSWSNGGKNWNWVPHNPADYAAFVTAASRKYPQVHLWQIWGEPSRSPNFQPLTKAKPGTKLNAAQRVAPHNYARLLDGAYGALKAVSRTNLVIGGCTYTSGDIDTAQWIANLRLPNGRPPRLDLYGQNPFSFRTPDFSNPPSPQGNVDFSDLKRLTRVLDRNLRPGLKLFLSEWTIPTGVDNEFNFSVDPVIAGRWVTAAMKLSRSFHRIYALSWIHLYDNLPLTAGGLLTSDGQRKPVFTAFADG